MYRNNFWFFCQNLAGKDHIDGCVLLIKVAFGIYFACSWISLACSGNCLWASGETVSETALMQEEEEAPTVSATTAPFFDHRILRLYRSGAVWSGRASYWRLTTCSMCLGKTTELCPKRVLTFFHADFGKEFPSRTFWRGASRSCPSPSSALYPFLYRTEHFSRGEKGEKVPRKGEEEGWPAKGAKRKKGRAKTGQCYSGNSRCSRTSVQYVTTQATKSRPPRPSRTDRPPFQRSAQATTRRQSASLATMERQGDWIYIYIYISLSLSLPPSLPLPLPLSPYIYIYISLSLYLSLSLSRSLSLSLIPSLPPSICPLSLHLPSLPPPPSMPLNLSLYPIDLPGSSSNSIWQSLSPYTLFFLPRLALPTSTTPSVTPPWSHPPSTSFSNSLHLSLLYEATRHSVHACEGHLAPGSIWQIGHFPFKMCVL